MTWVAVGVAAVGAVGAYASASSAADSQQESMEAQLKAEKELAQQKRDWELEDRKYRQAAVGNWAKYADPKLMPQSFGSQGTAGSGDVQPVQQTASAPQHPASFAGLRPVNGQAPQSLWFPRQFPSYDPNNPTGQANG